MALPNRPIKLSLRNVVVLLCVVLLALCLGSTRAQETPVSCSVGNGQCDGDLMEMSYAACCTLDSNSAVYYYYDGKCNKCGPVLNETDTLLVGGTDTTQVFRWSLHSDSIVPVVNVAVTFIEEGAVTAPFPSLLGPSDYRQMFSGLVTGETYVYAATALGADGARSTPIAISWEAGRSLLPTFKSFNQTDRSSSSVTAEWTLDSNGIRPLLQMVVRWRDGLASIEPDQFPDENIVVFDYTDDMQTDGAVFSHEFVGLAPSTRYAFLIEGRNYVGVSTTPFVLETGTALPVPATEGLISSGDSLTGSTLCLLLLLLFTILALT